MEQFFFRWVARINPGTGVIIRKHTGLLALTGALILVGTCSGPETGHHVIAPAHPGRDLNPNQSTEITSIAVGSCHNQNLPSPIFQTIARTDPDAFLFLGDIVYNDTEDIELISKNYRRLHAKESFRGLKQIADIYYLWDDHDYGSNDGGAEFPARMASRDAFLDMQGVPAGSKRRSRPGVYHAHIRRTGGLLLQLIFLDTRFNRSPLEERLWFLPGYASSSDPEKTFLGREQWAWLEDQLTKKADVRLIASGIQILNVDGHFEKWYNFREERKRLIDLISRLEVNGVIFVSGDRHIAEISRLPASDSLQPALDDSLDHVPYDLYELTASGLTHSWPGGVEFENRMRVQKAYGGLNFGSIRVLRYFPERGSVNAGPSPENGNDNDNGNVNGTIGIALEIRNDRGEVLQSVWTALRDLQFRNTSPEDWTDKL